MELILNHLLVLAGIIATMCVAYFAWVVSGVGNMAVKASLKNWSWKRFRTDLLKLACFTVSMMACSICSDVLAYYVSMLEVEVLDNAMVVVSWAVIVGIPMVATFYLLYRSLNNNKSLVNYEAGLKLIGTDKDVVAVDNPDKVAEIAENVEKVAEQVFTFFATPVDLAKKHKKFEEEGGRGAYYSVDITSYDTFRSATLGRGFDVDSAYDYQCWDLCAVLWQQFGQSLLTGNGCAYGCWTLKRDVNRNPNFDLITDRNNIKRGDVVVFGGGEFGHIGFADEDYHGGNYIRLLGQNQGGAPGPKGMGGITNVVNVSMGGFLGAFRYKKWATTTTSTTTTTTTTTKPTETPSAPTQTAHKGFNIGDKVVPTKKVDAFGAKLTQYDPQYTITGFRDDVNGAILSARGQIWAVMPLGDIKKA